MRSPSACDSWRRTAPRTSRASASRSTEASRPDNGQGEANGSHSNTRGDREPGVRRARGVRRGAGPDQPRRDLRVARHRLARPGRAGSDRRGRVRRPAQGRRQGRREDGPSGGRPGDVEAGMTRSVVIAGVGAVTPLGVGARTLHERWSAGVSGIEDGFGRAGEFEPKDHLSIKEVRRSDRFTQLALAATKEALEDAGWEGEPPGDPDRTACLIGTGIGGIGTLESQHIVLQEQGAERISPLSIPLLMANAASGVVAMKYGLRGQSFGTVSACAAGAHAIGMAERLIRYGDADYVVTGGSEAAITPLATAAFAKMDALSDSGVSRPFDRRRDGFVMGEGAGILVLEEEEAAKERGARADRPRRREGDRAGASRRRGETGRGRVRERARHVHTAQRPLRDERDQDRARGEAGWAGTGQLDQVGDRPPPGRGGCRGGNRHAARAARPDRAADAQLSGARRGARPRLRTERGTAAPE